MIKDNQKILNRIMVLIDAVIVGASFLLAYLIKFYVFEREPGVGVLPIESYVRVLPIVVPGYLLVYHFCQVYTPRRTGKPRYELWDVIRANTVGVLALAIYLYVIIHEGDYARSVIGISYMRNIFFCGLYRIVLRKALRSMRSRGYNLKHVLLVGYSRAAENYMDRLRENPQWGYHVMGVLDDHVPVGASYHGTEVIGTLSMLEELTAQHSLDEIVLTLPLEDYEKLEELVATCEKFGIHTKFVPDYNSVIPSKPYTEDVDGLPVINIRYVPLTNTGNIFLKRAFDILLSFVGIIVASPILLACALAVRFSGKGPVIFRQEREGWHNRTFCMYKFRTMEVQYEKDESTGWTVRNDPRVTKVGRFLRKTSLDELPQLFNILKGDMSLVGPRPERPQFVEKFMEEIPHYNVKHQVRPGLTGWAQVNGLRGDTSIRKRVEYDIFYIENWTLTFDLKIILMTFFTGFINKNAY